MNLSKINGALASIAAIIEADLGQTDILPALELPGEPSTSATPVSAKKPHRKRGMFPELVAEPNVAKAMQAGIGVNRSIEGFHRATDKLVQILKKRPELEKVKVILADIQSKLADLTKHTEELKKAFD